MSSTQLDRIASTGDFGVAERAPREELVAGSIEPWDPAPLRLRVLLTAEPFGFGPSAAIALLFRHLRPRLTSLGYAGAGHTLDLQAALSYDQLHDLGGGGADPYDGFAAVVERYDAVVASCDFRAAEIARRAGIPVAIYDPLAWYWTELPAVCRAAELYIAQDFFGVREAIRRATVQRLVVVPPLVPLDLHGEEPRDDLALLNLGGLKNPFLSDEECAAYAGFLADALLPLLSERFAEVQIVTSAAVASALRTRHPRMRTVSPVEAQRLLARCRLAVMTPGLGNIFEAAALSARVFWLPPANDSQGQQLRLLVDRDLAPHNADWDLLAGEREMPLDYRRPQAEVMVHVARAIRCAIADCSFGERLRARVAAALDAPVAEFDGLRALVGMFGWGGDRVTVDAVLEQMLEPLARRKEA